MPQIFLKNKVRELVLSHIRANSRAAVVKPVVVSPEMDTQLKSHRGTLDA